MDWERLLPIVVQFGIGALLCGVGVWTGLASGYVDFKYRQDRRLVATVVLGFVGLLAVYIAFTYWLPQLPERGAG